MEKLIERAIKETLVIENKGSIKLAVKKIMNIITLVDAARYFETNKNTKN